MIYGYSGREPCAAFANVRKKTVVCARIAHLVVIILYRFIVVVFRLNNKL